jgi:hypothetical protein
MLFHYSIQANQLFLKKMRAFSMQSRRTNSGIDNNSSQSTQDTNKSNQSGLKVTEKGGEGFKQFVKKHPIMTGLIIAMLIIAATVFTAGAVLIPGAFVALGSIGIFIGIISGSIIGCDLGRRLIRGRREGFAALIPLVLISGGASALFCALTASPILAVVVLGLAVTSLFGAIGAGIGVIIKVKAVTSGHDKKPNADANNPKNSNSYSHSHSKIRVATTNNSNVLSSNNNNVLPEVSTRGKSLGDISTVSPRSLKRPQAKPINNDNKQIDTIPGINGKKRRSK